jgi:hypothetical protein
VYRVPSAVFTSVTALLTLSTSVDEPLAYEPPTTETVAVVADSDMSWNIGLAAGNAEPLDTDSLTPFTAMTAEAGGGAGGAGGVFGALPEPPPPQPDDDPPEDDEDEPPEVGPPEWNGSLLSKSEKDWS